MNESEKTSAPPVGDFSTGLDTSRAIGERLRPPLEE